MPGTGIHAAELVVLLLLLFVIAFAALAQKLKTPYPIVLVVAGLLLGFVPHIPKVPLEPELVLLVILPPLLYSAAWLTSWQDFRHNLVSIVSLAIGLVAFTVLGVAVVSWLTGFDWRIGFVLGAVVATTDSIAATSIAGSNHSTTRPIIKPTAMPTTIRHTRRKMAKEMLAGAHLGRKNANSCDRDTIRLRRRQGRRTREPPQPRDMPRGAMVAVSTMGYYTK